MDFWEIDEETLYDNIFSKERDLGNLTALGQVIVAVLLLSSRVKRLTDLIAYKQVGLK